MHEGVAEVRRELGWFNDVLVCFLEEVIAYSVLRLKKVLFTHVKGFEASTVAHVLGAFSLAHLHAQVFDSVLHLSCYSWRGSVDVSQVPAEA